MLSFSILDHFMALLIRTFRYERKSRTSKIVRCNVEKCLQDNVERQAISVQAQYTTIPTKDLELNI